MPKVLLIQPSQYSYNGKLIKQKKLYLPGLVFPLLSALAPDNWEVEVKIEVIEDLDYNTDADIVGIGGMGHAVFRGLELAEKFKQTGKQVFMGGFMASVMPEFVLKTADSVIIGDAEISFPILLQDFESTGRIKQKYENPIHSLDGLPIPDYNVLTEKSVGNMLPVQAGRGCPHTCSFCTIACIYRGKYMTRPLNEVIRDIQHIKNLGYNKFYLIDDNLVSNPEYFSQFCDIIQPMKMKWSTQSTIGFAHDDKLLKKAVDSGCEILSIGIESIGQEGLDKLNKKWLRVNEHELLIKKITDAGIMVSAEMMIGTDSDTEESIKETLNFIKRTKIPLLRVYILTPIPGTPFFNEIKETNRLLHENFEQYTAAQCVHVPEKIPPQQLNLMYKWLNRKIFSYGGIINRTLLNPAILKHPLRYLFAFAVNLHYRSYVKKGDTPLIF